jgi:hypothetical protein
VGGFFFLFYFFFKFILGGLSNHSSFIDKYKYMNSRGYWVYLYDCLSKTIGNKVGRFKVLVSDMYARLMRLRVYT